MNTKSMLLAGTLIAVVALHGASLAQIVKKAQVGFRFLENPVSAEVMGRGCVGVVTTQTANGIFWNPALLGWIEPTVDVAINHTRWIADINYNAGAAAVRLGDVGVLGFSFLAMDYGTFYLTRRADNDQGYIETGTFTPTAIALGVAYSQRVSDRFSFGVHAKYVHQDLGDAWVSTTGDSLGDPSFNPEQRSYKKGALALDVGAYYDFLYSGIRFGATLQNISREYQYENEDFPLPFAVSFGVTLEPLTLFFDKDTTHTLVLAFESRHPRDFGEKAKIGAEYRFLDMFIGRLGYMTNYDERGWTLGIGVKQKLSDVPVRVDYAYEPFGILGGAHFISIGFSY
jgi:opacity protein-like surface antigen